MRSFLPLLAATALLLSGCGAAGSDSPLGLFAKGERAFSGQKIVKHKGGPGMAGGHGPALGAQWPGVVLSAEQQVQMKALAEKYAPAKPAAVDHDAQKAKRDALNAALMAETFDAAAFKAALTALHDGGDAPKARDPQFQVEARAILTDAQRAAAIAVLKALPEAPAKGERPAKVDRAEPQNHLVVALGLDEAQQAKLAALKPAEAPAKPDPAAARAAQIAFLETGDPANLPQPPAKPALNVDAIADFVASLDGPQRGKLAGMGLPGIGGGKPGMIMKGGPRGGGHGFGGGPLGGPGGKFGKGGPGGFAKGGDRPVKVRAEAGVVPAAE